MYEYGSRAGFWRILRLFNERGLHFTSWAVGRALELNPAAGKAMAAGGHEVASHGYRWINYKDFTLEQELDHMKQGGEGDRRLGRHAAGRLVHRPLRQGVAARRGEARRLPLFERFLQRRPAVLGQGRHGKEEGTPHLIIPYTLEVNDMKFAVAPGFGMADGWLQSMKDAFDMLYAEGARAPKMMSIGIHCRLAGRPSRAATLARFLDYVKSKPKVWVATRKEIAQHWMKVHPAS